MIYHYTKFAEDKFFILHKHGRQVFKEDINALVKSPEKIEKKYNLCFAEGILISTKEKWQVVHEQDDGVIKILTFYPLSEG